MIEAVFNPSYRDGRSYVHGTDLYNDTVSFLHQNNFVTISDFELIFKKIVHNKPAFFLSDTPIKKKENICATLSFINNEKKYYGVLYDSGQPITTSKQCNEGAIINNSIVSIEERRIESYETLDFSDIETTLFMAKHLAQSLYPDTTKKMLFRKIYLFSLLKNIPSHKKEVVISNIYREKLFNVDIIIDSKRMGYYTGIIIL